GHEPGGPAASDAPVRAALHTRAGSAPRGETRDHRAGPDQWPEYAELGTEIQSRRLVRRPREPPRRSANPVPNGRLRSEAAQHQRRRRPRRALVYGKLAASSRTSGARGRTLWAPLRTVRHMHRAMNVLLTCVGRRSYLVRF